MKALSRYQRFSKEEKIEYIERQKQWRANLSPEDDEVYRKRQSDRIKERRKEDPDIFRDKHLRYRYGISLPEWNEQFEKQGCCCQICKTTDPGPQGWHTDHDHVTGMFRSILCRKCNIRAEKGIAPWVHHATGDYVQESLDRARCLYETNTYTGTVQEFHVLRE